MKKTNRIRDFLTGAAAMTLVFALISPAGAALRSKSIQVFTGLSIYVDGYQLNPKDASGKSVEVFAYNGTTYVPLRAVGESLDKNVSYDSATQTVYVGQQPNAKQYLWEVCPPYEKSGYQGIEWVSPPDSRKMMGEKYTNGFYNSSYHSSSKQYALFNLNGQYDTLSFDVGHIDGLSKGGSITIYLDGKATFHLSSEDGDLDSEMRPKHYDIPLNQALNMKIEFDHCDYFFANAEIH